MTKDNAGKDWARAVILRIPLSRLKLCVKWDNPTVRMESNKGKHIGIIFWEVKVQHEQEL